MFKLFYNQWKWHFSNYKNPNADKAHRWDNIFIRIIQLCGKEIVLPLQSLFKSMLDEDIFPQGWQKVNAVLVHKKEIRIW